MRALAAVGFTNLSGEQNAILQLLPEVSARIAKGLAKLNDDSLPNGIVIYGYFERLPTGRKPVHIRLSPSKNELLVRLDVIAPRPNANPEALLGAFLSVWGAMRDALAKYLARKRVPKAVRQAVVSCLALPPVPRV